MAKNKPYGDNALYEIEKFAFFSKAALSILPVIGFRPDLIHCHDWQTGLIPVYLKERFAGGDFFRGIKTVMTIHNLKFQGRWNVKDVKDITGLPDYFFTSDKLEAYKDANGKILPGKRGMFYLTPMTERGKLSGDKFGNMNLGYVGFEMSLPEYVYLNFATPDKDDAFWVEYGMNMAKNGR